MTGKADGAVRKSYYLLKVVWMMELRWNYYATLEDPGDR